jgi:hypothetical protein
MFSDNSLSSCLSIADFDFDQALLIYHHQKLHSAYVSADLTSVTIPAVPEPSTMLLMVFGLIGLAGLRRKYKK